MTDLSADELAVLMIADRGQPMLAIGCWQGACEHLVQLGLLAPTPSGAADPSGQSNLRITPAGRAACQHQDDDALRGMIEVSGQIQSAHAEIRQQIEKAAQAIVVAVQTSMRLTGEQQNAELEKWTRVLRQRVADIISGQA